MDDIRRAIDRGDIDLVSTLVTPENVNTPESHGRVPLMFALTPIGAEPDPRLVSILLERGADVNYSERGQGWTALHVAARDQRREIVRILLDAGADIGAEDAFGNTPLLRALRGAQTDIELVRLLLAAGADPHRKNKAGVSAIDLVERAAMPNKAKILEVLTSGRRRIADR